MKSQAPFKLAWFQIKRCLFLLLPMCRNYLQLLKLLYFIGYKLHKKRHEYTLHAIHVVIAGFDFQFFCVSFLNLCIATQGDLLAIPSLQYC